MSYIQRDTFLINLLSSNCLHYELQLHTFLHEIDVNTSKHAFFNESKVRAKNKDYLFMISFIKINDSFQIYFRCLTIDYKIM